MKLVERIFRRKDYYITSPYGWRKDPISGVNKFHYGCDYGTNRQKWKQYSLENGVVVSAGKDLSGGIYAWVRFPRINIEVLYYHLDELFIKKNQVVNENTIIGTTGMSGHATGIHLHLTYRIIGSSTKLDPEKFNYILPTIANDTINDTINELKIGDKVKIIKKGKASSYGTGVNAGGIGWTREILKIYKDRAYPYRVGNSTGTTGFYKRNALEKL